MSGSWLSKAKWAGAGINRRMMLLTAAGGALAAAVPGTPGAAPARAAQPSKRALVLGGGALKGAYQAGAVKVLLNKGFEPDRLYGISAGGLNAAFLCDRASYLGKPKRLYYAELKQTPPANVGDLDAPVNWSFLGDELVAFWRTKVTGPSNLVKQWKQTDVALHALFGAFKGFLNVDPLEQLIAATLDANRLKASKVPTAIGAVNVDTTNIKYVQNTDPDFRQFILASTALPLVMPIVEVKSGPNAGRYADGGLKHVLPVKEAVADGLATHIIAIACQAPVNTEKYETLSNIKNVLQLNRRYSDIANDNVIERDIGYAMGKRIAVIRPESPLEFEIGNPNAEVNSFTPADINNLIARGEYYANKKLQEAKELTPEYFNL
jgi:NTE family protein